MIESRCGILCRQCKYREPMNCAGCIAIDKPFWGEACPVKSCCEGRGHEHCGQCDEFPCELLNEFAYDKEQGDNGKRIETCRIWANYECHGIDSCELSAEDVISTLEKETTFTLATCADNRVTTRSMSHVNDDLTVYFQTGEYYLKTQQIKSNPRVALSVGGYELEGIAEIIGHPMDEANKFFIEKYKNKHPNYAGRWSKIPNQIVVRVEIMRARQWRYIDGKPVIAIKHFNIPHIQENTFDSYRFIQDVVTQNADALKSYFTPNAIICWHDSNEQFTTSEYIRANCEYPGKWHGEMQRVELIDNGIVIVTKISSSESTHLVTSFIRLTNGKINRLDEYFSDCGEAPEWRQKMNIGRPIK